MKPNDQQTGSHSTRTTYAKIEQAYCPRLRVHCSSALLAVVALAIFAVSTATVEGEDYLYETNSGTITVTKYTGPGGDVTIPSTINGLPVTSIGEEAFRDCASVTNVMIPDGVITIGRQAFFYCLWLTTVTIGNSVTNIGEWAFGECWNLTKVTIPNTVTHIGGTAFSGCTSLTAIDVDPQNPAYSSLESVLFNKNQTTLIQYPGGKVGSYSIPDTVTNIGNYAFRSCTGLASVTIPDGVIDIGSGYFMSPDNGGGTFSSCGSLTNATIGNGVTSIGVSAFYECWKLTTVRIGNSVTNIGDSAFSGCGSLTSVSIPDNVVSIGFLAFCCCDSLTNVIIGNGVSNIGGGAFWSCDSLTSITLPHSVTTIGHDAFGCCRSLTSVTIPDSVVSIGDHAFDSCTSLANVRIPDSVTNIGYLAFHFCTSLTAIEVDRQNPAYSSFEGVLFNKSQTTLIQCPGGKVGSCTIPDSVSSIESAAFHCCTNLTSVTIPDSVVSIGDHAFYGCASLTSVTMGNSLSSVGWSMFGNCSSLAHVTISDSVTNIEPHAFSGCTSLTSVAIGNSVTRIDSAFYGCDRLTGLYFRGNAPSVHGDWSDGANNAIAYHLPGTTGWGTTLGRWPTALWQPHVRTSDGSFGMRTNQFGFNIIWASGRVVVVEASTGLSNPTWVSVSTNTVTDGWCYFNDAVWTNYLARFYRVRSQ